MADKGSSSEEGNKERKNGSATLVGTEKRGMGRGGSRTATIEIVATKA